MIPVGRIGNRREESCLDMVRLVISIRTWVNAGLVNGAQCVRLIDLSDLVSQTSIESMV